MWRRAVIGGLVGGGIVWVPAGFAALVAFASALIHGPAGRPPGPTPEGLILMLAVPAMIVVGPVTALLGAAVGAVSVLVWPASDKPPPAFPVTGRDEPGGRP